VSGGIVAALEYPLIQFSGFLRDHEERMTTTTKETLEEQLVRKINGLHEDVLSSFRRSLRNAKEAGDALVEAKKKYGQYGKWKDWIKTHFKASYQTAHVYMTISKGWKQLDKLAKGSEEFSSIDKALEYLRQLRNNGSPVRFTNDDLTEKEKQLASLRRSLNNILRDEIKQETQQWMEWTPEELAYLTTYPELKASLLRETLKDSLKAIKEPFFKELHTRIKQVVEQQPESPEEAPAKSRQKKKRADSSELDQVCDKLFNPDDAE
jgi:hypothetical protein